MWKESDNFYDFKYDSFYQTPIAVSWKKIIYVKLHYESLYSLTFQYPTLVLKRKIFVQIYILGFEQLIRVL